MTRKDKVNSGYTGLSGDELVVFAGNVVLAMTENDYFATPQPSLEELSTATTDYRTAQEAAANGSTYDKRLRDERKKKLFKILSELAFYVNKVADGNLAILSSSGMVLAKQPEETQTPPYVIERVLLKDGNKSGQMLVGCAAQKRVWGYEVQVGEGQEDGQRIVWQESFHSPKSKSILVESLMPGKRYYVRLRTRNAKGQSDWTEAVSMIAR